MKTPLLLILVLISSCGKFNFTRKSSQESQDVSKIYATGTLKVAVFYEPGAEPYTGLSGGALGLPQIQSVEVWNVLQENLKAMFPGKTIIVPKKLSEMNPLSDQGKTSWSFQAIKTLGETYGEASHGDISVFNVFFIKGSAEESSGVIGVHLSGTKTIGIFKDVVERSDTSAFVRTYVEQATLVHEMGHAVGLVNNGVPMVSAHEDADHRAHCNKTDCVMYWMNEGRENLVKFIENRRSNPSAVMLDQACLQDVNSYK